MKNRCLFFLTSFLAAIAFTAHAQDIIKLEGKILSAETKEPVAFAAIGLPEKGLGTVCDENGNFELKIPNVCKNQEICVNALGYKQNCRPVAGFQFENPTILLEPANLELATVEIKAISAESLVKEAIRRIPENYADKPVRYTFYQRQHEIINNKPAFIIESVNEAWRDHPKKDYQLRVLKSRGMAVGNNLEKMNKTRISFYDILTASDVKDYQDFLKLSNINQFTYTIEKQNILGQDTLIAISFQPKTNGKKIAKAGPEGRIFLHPSSKAIIRIETRENDAALQKLANNMIVKIASKIADTEVTFKGFSSQVDFKKYRNRWYLNQVVSEGIIQKTGEKFSKPEISNGIRQIVVTQIQTENTLEIPEEYRVKPYDNTYSTAPKDMNEAFWQQYNVLPLPEAYKNAQ